jgi:hypothetical protein
MGGHLGRDLFGRDKPVRRAIGMGDHEGQGDRRAVHIAAADVEQPGHRSSALTTAASRPCSPSHSAILPRLASLLSPASSSGWTKPGRARGGLIVPHGVERVAFHRHQLGALGGQRLAGGGNPRLGVQPRVIGDARAFAHLLGCPSAGAGGGHIVILIQPPIDLIAHLQRVAAIDEDRRLLPQHHRAARRAAKAGQPFQTLGIGADIFAHMLVADGDDEAVIAFAGKLRAQRRKAGFMGVHQHGGVPP